MNSFLLKEKKAVLWRGLKGSAIFGFGFYTRDATSPYSIRSSKEAKLALAKSKAFERDYRVSLADKKMIRKKLEDVLQYYRARVAKLEELKKEELKNAEPVETCCQ